MKLKKLAPLFLAFAMVFALAACGDEPAPPASGSAEPTEDAQPADTTITTVEMWSFEDGFYPAYSPDHSSHGFTYYSRNFYDTLVVREGDEFLPSLAESWEISDDGMSYTFHLREGVLFSDGAELTAEAVKTSVEAAIQNMGAYIGSFGRIGTLLESIEAADELTVVFHLASPYYGALNDLAMSNPMAIVSPNAFNEDLTVKDELLNQTMGTGPYMCAGDGDGTYYTFVANPNYWGEAPDVTEFTVEVITDPEAAVLALRSGELDLIPGASRLSFAGYSELSEAEGFATMVDESVSNSRFIGFNTQAAPFDDLAVRQAVAQALDRETLSDTVFAGIETPSDALIDRSLIYCDVDTVTYDYDLELAAAALEDAGWTDSDGDGIREKDGASLSVTLDYITDQGSLDNAVLIMEQTLEDIGFDVTLRGSDSVTWFTNIAMGDWDFTVHSTYGGYYYPYLTLTNMNPDTMGDPVLAQVAYFVDGGSELFAELDSTSDLDRVAEIYAEALNAAADNAVLVPLTYVHQYAAYNTGKIASFSFGSDQLFIEIANVVLA